jgi:hypothetical protein
MWPVIGFARDQQPTFPALEGILRFIPRRLILQTSSGQKSNDGIKSLTGIVWFELYLQTTLTAIQEYA